MIIKASELGKDFNLNRIFNKFSYTFQSGNSYAITGPNGSGKSTLLMILAGYMNPSRGDLEYYDSEAKLHPDDWYKHLTIVAPYLQLVEEFTLEEFLSFHFSFKSLRKDVILKDIPSLCGLDPHRGTFIKNFSSGMKQRLKLATGFYSDTSLLFFDEPTSNLDASGIAWFRKEIIGILAQKLIIIASNQANEHDFCKFTINLSTLK